MPDSDADLDPAIAAWQLKVLPGEEPVTVADARDRTERANALALAELDPVLTPPSETSASVPGDPPLEVRVLRPAATPGGTELATSPMPTVVYFHGGGWMLGDPDTHLGQARRICTQVGAVVVSVGYRRAPEHRFPTAFDDALRATEWVGQQLDQFGGTDQLVLAGESAGGQLAASVAIARRDAGLPVAAQLLLYPVTDALGRYVDEDVNAGYMSRRSQYQRFGLTIETMATFAAAYVDEADSGDWRVSPKRCADLSGLAPAVIHTSTLDVLRTEGNFFGDDLRAAGVRVITREHPSLNHSYFGLGGVSAIADAAAAQAADDLNDVLERSVRSA